MKDLGQYNIILEGRSVTDIVNSTEGNLEDLPLVLHSVNRTIEECLSSLDIVALPLAAVDVPVEVKRLLQLLVKVFDQQATTDDVLNKLVDTVVSGVSSYVTDNVDFFLKNKNCTAVASSVDSGIFHDITDKVKKGILDLNEIQESDVPLGSSALLSFLESETLASPQQLVDMLTPYIQFESDSLGTAFPQLSKVLQNY